MGRSADNQTTSEGTGTVTGTGTKITTGSVQLSTHSASLGGAGGPVRQPGRGGEYDGIWLNPDDTSSDMVPIRAWNKLKRAIDDAGLRMEYQADYQATNERLREAFGLPLRGGHKVAGYEQEVWLFKRWHLRIHGSPPSRWPWQAIPEAT